MDSNSPWRGQSGLRRLSSLAKGHRVLAVTAAGCALALLGGGIATASTLAFQQVGTQYRGGEQIASNQMIKPIGDRLMTPFGKIMGSVVSPNGRYLVGTSTDGSVDLQV